MAIKPEYEWDLMSVRVQKLLLKNHVCIENAVEDLKLQCVTFDKEVLCNLSL